MMEVVVEEPEMILVEKIKNAREKDEEVIKVVEKMKKAEVKALRENKLKIEGELVRKEGKVYVLKDKELRIEVIWLHHDMLVAKYRERWKMIELVTRNYQWPEVTRDVKGCDLCQRMKNRTETPVGKLMMNKVLEKSQMYLMVDFITKLLLVVGKDVILVMCNKLSKMIHFVATIERTPVERLVRLFRDNMWKLHGLLESVILDRRPQFAVELTKELNKMLGIQ